MKYKIAHLEDYPEEDLYSAFAKASIKNQTDLVTLVISIESFLDAIENGDKLRKEVTLNVLKNNVQKHLS